MSSEQQTTIEIAQAFSKFPAGRFKSDGPFSGEKFRDDILVPALKSGVRVRVLLDGVAGYGSSFLEEAFGGLVRKKLVPKSDLLTRVELVASDPSLVEEIKEYMVDAE